MYNTNMSKITHYKSPNITKLDGRYKGYNRGFRYRIDFDTQGEKWQVWMAVMKWCENTWGKEYTWSHDGFLPCRVWSDDYRTELSKKNKYYRHLYLCREEDVTMMLLVAQ